MAEHLRPQWPCVSRCPSDFRQHKQGKQHRWWGESNNNWNDQTSSAQGSTYPIPLARESAWICFKCVLKNPQQNPSRITYERWLIWHYLPHSRRRRRTKHWISVRSLQLTACRMPLAPCCICHLHKSNLHMHRWLEVAPPVASVDPNVGTDVGQQAQSRCINTYTTPKKAGTQSHCVLMSLLKRYLSMNTHRARSTHQIYADSPKYVYMYTCILKCVCSQTNSHKYGLWQPSTRQRLRSFNVREGYNF